MAMSNTLSDPHNPHGRGPSREDLLLQRSCQLDYNSSSESRSDDDDDDLITDDDLSHGGGLRRRGRRSIESSGVSTPTEPSPAPLLTRGTERKDEKKGHLEVPRPGPGREAISRSPSPLGLIPIHRSFSKLIHKHEVPRKLLHVSIGGVGIYLYKAGYQPANITLWLAAALVPVASADFLRFNWDAFNRFYIRVLGALMRESEVQRTNGVVFFLMGTLTVLAVLPKDVATLSIILLSWCDTAASTFGRAYGRYTPKIRKGKSVAGSLASFVVGALTAAVFWGWIVPSTDRFWNDPPNSVMWGGKLGWDFKGLLGLGEVAVQGKWALGLMSLWTGLVASASEVVDIWGLDDNVVIPVLSGLGIWGFLKIFG